MSKRVDYRTNELLPREKHARPVDMAKARLEALDEKLGVGHGARSERDMLQQIIDGGGTAARKTRRGKRKPKNSQ
jgi:hypothetical protein